MPRIDPQKLLTCLSVLLAPNGGIRSSDEVKRLAGLMDKFSKKLVSKCIYIQICKSTETELLGQFMAAGGWSLTHNWLSEGILTQNWPLVRELLELLLLCPVDVARLKSNSAPKLVKQLSKEGSQENVRILATKLVEQWLKIVKGETMTNVDTKTNHSIIPNGQPEQTIHNNTDGTEQTFILSKLSKNSELTVSSNKNNPTNDSIVENGDVRLTDCSNSTEENQNEKDSLDIKDNLFIKNDVKSSSKEKDKISTDKDRRKDRERTKEKSSSSRHERDKKDDRKKSSSSSSSSSKLKSSSSSHKTSSSHKSSSSTSSSSRSSSSSRNKERDRSKTSSSSSKSGSTSKEKVQLSKEREKSKEIITEPKVVQEDKDKETLAKLVPPSIDKLGKIPKKTKEPGTGTAAIFDPPVKKTPSISIEVRKDVENRPKTVKTFNSQFRSHGLAEEAPPPPSRKGLKKPINTGISSFSISTPPPVSQPMKRPSPPPSNKEPVPEKKLKIDIPIVVEKQIGIKLIPPKPKPVTLVESDMFMDAISASVPPLKKDSKKRKRRISASKEGGQTSSPPESPTTPVSPAPGKSTAASAPALKFYQDTLDDNDESKKAKKDNAADQTKSDEKDKEENVEKINKDDDVVMEEGKQDGVEEKEATNSEVDTSVSDDKKEEEDAIKPPGPGCGPNGPPGVLVIHRRSGPKKQLKWRPQESLEEVRFFELDETERVNVTKTFIDAKQMERCQEREFVQTARNKFQGIDKMFEETEWVTPLIEVEGMPPHPAGSQSKEKRIQFDREQTVLKVLYFSRHTIPDSPAEPDMEYYNLTDPVSIPLNDITGNPDTVKCLRNILWPEPKLSGPSNMPMSNMNMPHSFGGGPPFMNVDVPRPGPWPNQSPIRMPSPYNANDFSPPHNSPPFGGGGMNQNFGMNMMPNIMNMGMNNMKDNLPIRMQPNNNNNNGNWFRPNGPPSWANNNKNNRDRDDVGRGRGGGSYNGGRNDRGRNRGNSRYGGGYKSGTKNY